MIKRPCNMTVLYIDMICSKLNISFTCQNARGIKIYKNLMHPIELFNWVLFNIHRDNIA
jgi:hypothetical protein